MDAGGGRVDVRGGADGGQGRHALRPPARQGETRLALFQFYLTPGVFKVVVQTSIPTQIRQLIVHINDSKG